MPRIYSILIKVLFLNFGKKLAKIEVYYIFFNKLTHGYQFFLLERDNPNDKVELMHSYIFHWCYD